MLDKTKYLMLLLFLSLLVFYAIVFFIIKFTGKTNLQAFKEIGIIALILTSLSVYISKKVS